MAKSDKGEAERGGKTIGEPDTPTPRRRRKPMPSLGESEMSGLEQSAAERVEPARAAFESAAPRDGQGSDAGPPEVETPVRAVADPVLSEAVESLAPVASAPNLSPPGVSTPAVASLSPPEPTPARIEEVSVMSEAVPSPAVPPAAPPPATDGLSVQIASAKSLAGSALGMAVLAAVIAGVAVIFGPIPALVNNDRQQVALEMQQMQARLVKQERESRALALALAIEQVKAVAVRPVPFDAAIGGLAAVTAGDVDAQRLLDSLRPLARSGVPTLRQLKEEYSSLVGPVLVASAMPGDPHWMKQAVARMTGWTAKISSQLPIETYPPATHATLNRAADALEHDALKDAIATLKTLEGSAQVMLQPWLASASRRLAVEETLGQLSVLATSRLAAARS
jgi:hypothetical protein